MASNTTGGGGTSLDAIASLLQLIQGNKTTVSGGQLNSTTTTSKNINPENLAAVLKLALDSNAGLASVGQGQKTAGLYNSSTNRLLTNDLLSRLTAQASANSGTETRTVTGSPQVTKAGGIQNQDALSKLMLALTAYSKLTGKDKATGKSPLDDLVGGAKDIFGLVSAPSNAAAASSSAPTMGDLASLNMTSAPSFMNFMPELSASQPSFQGLDNIISSGGASGYGNILSDSFSGFTADQIGSVPSAGEFTVPTEAELGDAGNFPQASATSSPNLNSGNPSAGEVLSEATKSANTTVNLNSVGSSVYNLYGGITALTDGNSKNNAQGAVQTAAGAYGAYKAYDTYQAAQAAQAAAQSAEAAGAATTASTTGSSFTSGIGAGTGSYLGYIGPILSAFNAPNNPKGAQNPDYRHAVGSAVLNYFNMGWASPIVHEIAQPALDAAMDAGTESMGTFGAVLADPVGAPLSGQYEIGDLVQSTLDPANIFGKNPGGSTGAIAGALIDPVGAALGDKGVFSVVKDVVDRVETSDPIGNAVGSILGQGSKGGGLPGPGRVVCTELAFQGLIAIEKYMSVLRPGVTLEGRILLGYHILGVPMVKLMRKSPKFTNYMLPYVNAYLDYKLGKKSVTGFLIKYIGEPLCWCLSFFNRDPDYYKVLYPYRRDRNVS